MAEDGQSQADPRHAGDVGLEMMVGFLNFACSIFERHVWMC